MDNPTPALPERLAASIARIERGESTVMDARILSEGLAAAIAVVSADQCSDIVGFYRQLSRLRAWYSLVRQE